MLLSDDPDVNDYQYKENQMRKVAAWLFISLDGVTESPD